VHRLAEDEPRAWVAAPEGEGAYYHRRTPEARWWACVEVYRRKGDGVTVALVTDADGNDETEVDVATMPGEWSRCG
jgi:hypothetical protein